MQGFTNNSAPIGVFDSGYGGLTVVRELMRALPHEDIIYVGDSARCPYGPRDLSEVDGFVQQICSWLKDQGVKLIVIACNTATAAGLEHARATMDIPVIGVVRPGARAAVNATRNRRVGVIATKGTVESGVYSSTIREYDSDITVFSVPTPRFVEIAELGLRMADDPMEDRISRASDIYVRPEFSGIAREYLEPLRRCGVDTLVLGCTHYPLLSTLIESVMGQGVRLVSSAQEVVRDVYEELLRNGGLAPEANQGNYRFYTTGEDATEFGHFGSRVLDTPLDEVRHLDLP